MKKDREKACVGLEIFSSVASLVAAVFCVLFLLDVFQNLWILNFILGVAVLMHAALFLQMFLRGKKVFAVCAILTALCYAGCLIYFNIG